MRFSRGVLLSIVACLLACTSKQPTRVQFVFSRTQAAAALGATPVGVTLSGECVDGTAIDTVSLELADDDAFSATLPPCGEAELTIAVDAHSTADATRVLPAYFAKAKVVLVPGTVEAT